LRHRQKRYLNGELFPDNLRAVFLPHLAGLPGSDELAAGEVARSMDERSPHLPQRQLSFLPMREFPSLFSHRMRHRSVRFLILHCLLWSNGTVNTDCPSTARNSPIHRKCLSRFPAHDG
jgi:hypothetical protein